jgi:phage FluMu protein Com
MIQSDSHLVPIPVVLRRIRCAQCTVIFTLSTTFQQSNFYKENIMEVLGTTHVSTMRYTRLKCPVCDSMNVEALHTGQDTGRAIGTLAGGAAGAAGLWNGTESGAGVGTFSGVMSAIFGGLVGAAAGRTIGDNIGSAVDERLLDNLHCMSCDHTFRKN